MKPLPLLILVGVLLAGCAAAPSLPASDAPSGPQVPKGSVAIQPTDNETPTGSLEGRVVDDESVPVQDAFVAIEGLQVEVRTTDAGVFKFQNVPVGSRRLLVSAIGFESQSRNVDVLEGQNPTVVFVLVPIPLLVPHHASFPNTFFIHFGVYGSVLAGGETACEKCNWAPKIEPNPSFVVLEIRGKHTVAYPTRPDGLALFIHKNAAGGEYVQFCGWVGANPDVPCLRLPMRITYNQTYLNSVVPVDKPTTGLFFNQWCDPFWVCVEERYDEWMTLFYDTPEEAVPRDYSAWPA